jgi:hypothetical protein
MLDASRATSVPRRPIATPICAAFSEGASFTPSPVIPTTCPAAFNAVTMRSFCSGMMRAKIVTSATAPARSAFDMAASSGSVVARSPCNRACAAMAFAVTG